jgi:hypothetical protein
MAAKQELKTLLSKTLTSAYSIVATTPGSFTERPVSLAIQANFTYGSGGTSVDVYVQTSLDGGVTWVDIAQFSFATTTARKAYNLTNAAVTTQATPGDGTLTGNTCVNGFLGSLYRIKSVVVASSAYAGGTTIVVTAVPT